MAPSGVQKERIEPDDLFVCDAHGAVLRAPAPERQLRCSQCAPLFMNAYELRNAGAVIHSHSQHAVLVTLLFGAEFRITHQEMLKGIWRGSSAMVHRYDDTLVVPIIENTPEERDLKASMAHAMQRYPDSNAVLVRRHGVYVCGRTWQQTKSMCECYDYLFELACRMRQLGLDPAAAPAASLPP